jgi:hypothetical protein
VSTLHEALFRPRTSQSREDAAAIAKVVRGTDRCGRSRKAGGVGRLREGAVGIVSPYFGASRRGKGSSASSCSKLLMCLYPCVMYSRRVAYPCYGDGTDPKPDGLAVTAVCACRMFRHVDMRAVCEVEGP